MIGLLLVRFDPLFGPSIFLKAPKSLKTEIIQDIPSLIELPTKGVFIHIFKEIKTANLFFKQPNKFARGGYESFLISILTDVKTQISLILANKLLKGFANYLINFEDAYLAFDYEPKDHKADTNKLKEIQNFFFSYFESIKPVIKTLEMAEHRYQALFQAARDAIFIINRDTGVIIDVNLEAERLMEKTRDEIIGIEALQLDLFDEGLVDPNMIKHLIEQPPPIISRKRKSTGTLLYLEVSVNEIKLGEEFYIQYLFHDFTDVYSIEEKLKEHAKKIDTLNNFISIANQATNLSDLLNKTLNSIIDFLNLKGCCIYLVNKIQNIASIKAHKGLPEFFFENNNNIDINKNPYGTVFSQGVALFNENFPGVIRQFFKGYDSISGAVIPLFSKFEIIGSVNMILNDQKRISAEEMELIISITLEIGTAIDKLKNQEDLKQSEAKNSILIKHIPFSIFRISLDGILMDAQLDRKIEKIFEIASSTSYFIGRSVYEILPKEIAEEALVNIEKALEKKESVVMKFIIPYKENKIIFRSDIVPIGKNEVLAFLQNLTRAW
ncbi:MAG: PAS domain S-box protein [Candidatus Lokiarchaeota archaeon]|nr:PAS domain S-box protein [Candidatus Lokiarchaeota archaeon]